MKSCPVASTSVGKARPARSASEIPGPSAEIVVSSAEVTATGWPVEKAEQRGQIVGRLSGKQGVRGACDKRRPRLVRGNLASSSPTSRFGRMLAGAGSTTQAGRASTSPRTSSGRRTAMRLAIAAPMRDAADDYGRQAEMFDQGGDVAGEGGDGEHIPRLRSAVAAAFQRDQPKGSIVRKRLRRLPRIAAKTVLEDDRLAVATGIVGGERQPVADEVEAPQPVESHRRRSPRKAATPGASCARRGRGSPDRR